MNVTRDFPHFAGVKVYETVLSPGDALILPAHWFHHVDAIDTRLEVANHTHTILHHHHMHVLL